MLIEIENYGSFFLIQNQTQSDSGIPRASPDLRKSNSADKSTPVKPTHKAALVSSSSTPGKLENCLHFSK